MPSRFDTLPTTPRPGERATKKVALPTCPRPALLGIELCVCLQFCRTHFLLEPCSAAQCGRASVDTCPSLSHRLAMSCIVVRAAPCPPPSVFISLPTHTNRHGTPRLSLGTGIFLRLLIFSRFLIIFSFVSFLPLATWRWRHESHSTPKSTKTSFVLLLRFICSYITCSCPPNVPLFTPPATYTRSSEPVPYHALPPPSRYPLTPLTFRFAVYVTPFSYAQLCKSVRVHSRNSVMLLACVSYIRMQCTWLSVVAHDICCVGSA